MTPVKVGVIGCGNISDAYLHVMKSLERVEVAACADLIRERAEAQAAKHGVPKACSVEELLADPEIGIVLNLTIPLAHAEVALKALDAGKSVYNEKPLAVTREDGKTIIDRARQKGLRVGCAPDTFMGGGIQTCRKLIDDGWIGEPVAATAFMQCHGHEHWHPDPDFYYQPGGGPMFDMGPYYLTALVALLGPVRRVAGSARITFAERLITSEPRRGTVVKVNTPTHIAGTMDFRSGAVGTIVTSFDVWVHTLPCIEIHGTEGSLSVPDPNTFGGVVRLFRKGGKDWATVPLSHGYTENSRGIGLADMANALQSGRPHRASGDLAYHVLDIMHAFLTSSEKGAYVELDSACEKPLPVPMDLRPGTLDP
jgi:predicted dehydrogenase